MRAGVPVEEALQRIESIYKPYHAALAPADCPHPCAIRFRRADRLPLDAGQYPRRRQQCRVRISSSATATAPAPQPSCRARRCSILEELGFTAVRNKPYAGGFITEHYGRPARGLHALQIEVNRSLYVDEATLGKASGFRAWLPAPSPRFMRQMADVCGKIRRRHGTGCRIDWPLLTEMSFTAKKNRAEARLSLGRKHPRRVFTVRRL